MSDWVNAVRKLAEEHNVYLFSDLFCSEGHTVLNAKCPNDPFLTIDKLLLNKQGRNAQVVRNTVKLTLVFLQALRLRAYNLKKNRHEDHIYHAHSFYYILICALSGVNFVATPMGSDYLVRPKNFLYSKIAFWALRKARKITVDTIVLHDLLRERDINSSLIQNGINAYEYNYSMSNKVDRFLSIRGIEPLYQIYDLIEARNAYEGKIVPLEFIFPFFDENYFNECKAISKDIDMFYGRLQKTDMKELLSTTGLVISIPESDASPRSVYEAIFSGCIVATIKLPWLKMLSENMMSRIILVDLARTDWFAKMVVEYEEKKEVFFSPSLQDFEKFDTETQMKLLIHEVYNIS